VIERWGFRVLQGGVTVAEGDGPMDDIIREAHHYTFVYGQDGPCHAIVGPLPLPEAPE